MTRLLLACLVLVTAAGCRQDMHDQAKYEPLEASGLFADGASSRPLVEGTVARGLLREDARLYRGLEADGSFVAEIPLPVTPSWWRAAASASTSSARPATAAPATARA